MKRRLHLSVGINDYPGTGADLRGCVNDALDWDALLTTEGYTGTVLLNEQATKANILGRLREMVAEARFGDRIVFTFSGHGSWIPDLDGDEVDGRDEVLCAYDFRAGGLISDDELHDVFSERRAGVRVLVIPDACHSGTLHKFVSLHVDPDLRPRFLAPAEFLSEEGLVRAVVVAEETSRGYSRTQTALLSGCMDHEYSYDTSFGGRPNGALTHAAINAYQHGQSLAAWHKAIRATPLPSDRIRQTPQLQATTHQRRWSIA